MDLFELFGIVIGVVLVNNFVFSRFLGLCPYIGVSHHSSSAMGMGMAVVFVMTMSAMVTWGVYQWVLEPLGIAYLYIVAFILVIASFVQLVEIFLQKALPALHRALGIYLPLITTNCAVLGVATLNRQDFFGEPGSFLKCLAQGFGAGIGFMLAMLIMAGIRERLELSDVPESLKGVPIAFITAGLVAIAFLGFSGLLT